MSAYVYAPRNATVYPASPKQVKFIGTLRAERGLDFDPEVVAQFTSTEAGHEIDRLLAMPKAAQAVAAPGYHFTKDGDPIKVIKTKDGERVYAKKLEAYLDANSNKRGRWVYAPGVAATVAGLTPMTAEEAGAKGIALGFCLICGKTLQDPDRVNGKGKPGEKGYKPAGIGPVCVKKLA